MARRILVIDDEQDLLDFLRKVLEEEGYAVATAPDGVQGISRARHEPPDLILLDLMMPQMDGWEVLRILKSLPQTSRTPVVVLTARMDPQSKWEGWQQGAVDYITKPFSLQELKLRLKEILLQLGDRP
jgi:DNA-binding response OmpR family regulator